MDGVYQLPPGKFFQWSLAPLREAFDGACFRPRQRWHQADAAYRRLGVDIENFGGETEQDRWSRVDQEEFLDAEMVAAERTLELIRETFVISLFHFWERWVVQEMRMEIAYRQDLSDAAKGETLKAMRYGHDRVIGFLRRYGLAPDPHKLRTLQLAANVAKHSGGHDDGKLFALRPELFEARRLTYSDATSYDLRFDDGFVGEMFDMVAASGPPVTDG